MRFKKLLMVGMLFSVAACGDSDSKSEDPGTTFGSLDLTAFSGYCKLTLNEAYEKEEIDGDVVSIDSGESLLLVGTGITDTRYEVIIPDSFPVASIFIDTTEIDATSECTADNTTRSLATFNDITVYSNQELEGDSCTFSTGIIEPNVASTDMAVERLNADSDMLYQIRFDGLSCGGEDLLYTSIKSINYRYQIPLDYVYKLDSTP